MYGQNIYGTTPYGAPSGSPAPGAFNISVGETFALTDTITVRFSILSNDAFVLADTATPDTRLLLRETFRLTETVLTQALFFKSASSTFRLLDALKRVEQVIAEENFELTDGAATTALKYQRASDRLVLSDIVSTHLEAYAAITSVLALRDSAVSLSAIVAGDTFDLSDQVSELLVAYIQAASTLNLADAAVDTMRIIASAADTVSLTDSTILSAIFHQTASDSFFMSARINLGGEEYVAWVMNAESKAVWNYLNFPFDSMIEHRGRYYGANDSGVFSFGGPNDDGEEISARVKTGLLAFGSTRFKRIPYGYLGYTATGRVILKATTAEKDGRVERWYELKEKSATPTAMRTGKFTLGKGVKATYAEWELANVSGADFAVDEITWVVMPLSRKI